ncbi:MAG: hypothetical protein ABFD16_18835 [Thermoguttaceae bacterium]
MSCGICARCKKRKGCRFRQPGTWVEECDRFVAAVGNPLGNAPGRNSAAQGNNLSPTSQSGSGRSRANG